MADFDENDLPVGHGHGNSGEDDGKPQTEMDASDDRRRSKNRPRAGRQVQVTPTVDRTVDRSSVPYPTPTLEGQSASARDRIIAVYTGGTGLDAKTDLMIRSIGEGFQLREDDPLWIILIPALLRGADAGQQRELAVAIGELRETVTGKSGLAMPLKNLERSFSEQFQRLDEAIQENAQAINIATIKTAKNI
jgi:hypothetical protein